MPFTGLSQVTTWNCHVSFSLTSGNSHPSITYHENISSLQGPAGRVWATPWLTRLTLPRPSIRWKRHESAMSNVFPLLFAVRKRDVCADREADENILFTGEMLSL